MQDKIIQFYIDNEKAILIGAGVIAGLALGYAGHRAYMNSALFLVVDKRNMSQLLLGKELVYPLGKTAEKEFGLIVEMATKEIVKSI